MGTYDTIGGTPRSPDETEPPCEICRRICRTCGKYAKNCECPTGPDCNQECPDEKELLLLKLDAGTIT